MTHPIPKDFAARLADFKKKRILVVGDIMLDTFIRGDVERVSSEAPVPVVLETSRSAHLGGAGNTAANISALGAHTILVGVIGSDTEGRTVKRLARAARIKLHAVIDSVRPTTTKTRIAARHHQLVRVDREWSALFRAPVARKLLRILARLPTPDVVVVSDYAKGVVAAELVTALKRRYGARKILADFRPAQASLFRHVRVITPNTLEAFQLCGVRASTDAEAERAVRLLAKHSDSSVVLTRGEQGMTVYERGNGRPVHIPSHAREVFDVTGAGDTVAAILGLMLACGANLYDAARAANYAAGIVVGREGTAAVSSKELAVLVARER
jgi:D-beta-D-heptose 7-phosphate kinase/D-beta-D-heptose 1-phosphate adenosyltransferase